MHGMDNFLYDGSQSLVELFKSGQPEKNLEELRERTVILSFKLLGDLEENNDTEQSYFKSEMKVFRDCLSSAKASFITIIMVSLRAHFEELQREEHREELADPNDVMNNTRTLRIRRDEADLTLVVKSEGELKTALTSIIAEMEVWSKQVFHLGGCYFKIQIINTNGPF